MSAGCGVTGVHSVAALFHTALEDRVISDVSSNGIAYSVAFPEAWELVVRIAVISTPNVLANAVADHLLP
jgi:hypothetical protein